MPQYKGLIHGTTQIIKSEGILGIYRGLFPVVGYTSTYLRRISILIIFQMMRQGANSAVRFSTYSSLKAFVQGNARPGQQLPGSITFAVGAMAGLVTTYVTMPLDVIKTRMQSLEARNKYQNSFHCAYKTYTEDGLLRFWAGTTPRLMRLVVSPTSESLSVYTAHARHL